MSLGERNNIRRQKRRIRRRKQDVEQQHQIFKSDKWQRCYLGPQMYFCCAPWICLFLLPSSTTAQELPPIPYQEEDFQLQEEPFPPSPYEEDVDSKLQEEAFRPTTYQDEVEDLPLIPFEEEVDFQAQEGVDHVVDSPGLIQVPSIDPVRPPVESYPNETANGGNDERERIDETTEEVRQDERREEVHQDDFMDWCKSILGIETILETNTFEYYDYMSALPGPEAEDDDFFYDDFVNHDDNERSEVDLPMIPVRGLQASRDIEVGEIVIRIPLQALLTVSTTIDHDPVLSEVMGPKARKKYGWYLGADDDTEETMPPTPAPTTDDNMVAEELDQRADFFELPLLAVALLHHRKLGKDSPIHPYIQMLLQSPTGSMPFLWGRGEKWRSISEGIRSVARSLRKEMKEMYHIVVEVLVQDYPDLFGPPPPPTESNDSEELQDDNGEQQQQQQNEEEKEWFFSYEHFSWAFAMVNSRHWELPIDDLDVISALDQHNLTEEQPHERTKAEEDLLFAVDGQVPPAAMPTESWVLQQEHEDHDNIQNQENMFQNKKPSFYSFLAPVADLLNFGPPCTKVRYNNEMHSFDVTASCPFKKGQEVTFWYSDECDHIIVGNYGFTHPMVPKCPTAEDYHQSRDRWRKRAELLGNQLKIAYEDLDGVQWKLQHVQSILDGCECCQDQDNPEREVQTDSLPAKDQQNQNHVRGSVSNQNKDRHGVRRMWKEQINDL